MVGAAHLPANSGSYKSIKSGQQAGTAAANSNRASAMKIADGKDVAEAEIPEADDQQRSMKEDQQSRRSQVGSRRISNASRQSVRDIARGRQSIDQ